ncbi:MAG: hypothetical protein ACI9XO_000978 [Paraglaciecola sp.]|jgi:hypothetical protein
MTLYPNPVNQYLEINHAEINLEYTLFRADGSQVANGILKQQDQLDFSSLQSGTYFLKVANEEGTGVQKILKIK